MNGRDVGSLHGGELARFRRNDLGFIFQDSNLLDTLTAFENIALALTIQKAPARQIEARVRQAAAVLGVDDVLAKHPYQLSAAEAARSGGGARHRGRPQLDSGPDLRGRSIRSRLGSFWSRSSA